jgi:ribosomal protein L15/predicted transport protein
MSYGIKPYMSWGAESFRYGRRTLAKMTIRGKTLNLFLALNTSDYENTKYIYEDVSDVTKYSMVPMRNKIRSDRAVKWAKELIADLANKNSLKSVGHKVESFVPEYQDLDTLIQMGKIKVLTTGNGTEQEVTPADFEALKREKFHTITGKDMVEKVSAEEADVTLSDEVVKEFVQEEHVVVHKNNGKKKKSVGIINVDTLSKNFGAGEEVTLEKLIEKGLLAKSTTGYKVLARGELDKPLKVVSDDFSVQAIKMIVLTGGDAIIKKVDKV